MFVCVCVFVCFRHAPAIVYTNDALSTAATHLTQTLHVPGGDLFREAQALGKVGGHPNFTCPDVGVRRDHRAARVNGRVLNELPHTTHTQ